MLGVGEQGNCLLQGGPILPLGLVQVPGADSLGPSCVPGVGRVLVVEGPHHGGYQDGFGKEG
eukprot:7440402-Lingulodinium_polyedra.AAC.1